MKLIFSLNNSRGNFTSNIKNTTKIIGIISVFVLSVSCRAQINDDTYRIPDKLNDGWEVSTLKEADINTDAILELIKRIKKGEFGNIRSMVIVRNGRLVFEKYFSGSDRKDLFTVYSVSKSVTSVLVGIAIDRNFIKSVEEPVMKYFPEYSSIIHDEKKRNIKIKHLLTLTSGFDWDEGTYSYEDSRNVHVQMEQTNDWIKFILMRDVINTPGSRFLYNTGNVQLLSAVIKKTTGLHLDKFAEKYLFGPLGISKYYWNSDPGGYICAGGSDGGLRISSRDLAKTGYLYLNKGKWKNHQILSENWIKTSTQKYIDTGGNRGYGYLWWTNYFTKNNKTSPVFFASGFGSHRMAIIPDYDLLVVFNCYGARLSTPMELIVDSIK